VQGIEMLVETLVKKLLKTHPVGGVPCRGSIDQWNTMKAFSAR